jgi:RimJ/RimL family protein N-acetyltransferase
MGTASYGDIIVRPARPEDLDAALDLYADVAAEGIHVAGEAPVDKPARRKQWLESLARADSVTLVAEVDGEIVGLAGLEGKEVAELGMVVASGWRRRGIGTRLMEALIAWARSVGAHKISLHVWPHNAAALRLYEKFGFEREGYLRKHYRRRNGKMWDAVVMGRLLNG